uniref:Stress-induced-phosphoprotein 1-like n=1 Tax=Ciona intestinalis TaxID=7719 RepID=F7B704_CIOIN|nr:stress-induced-phosphoprotein 1-like [Ciona intestinalis]|eukprot:XP_002126001.1 stress-induced-phosphoprotein 1-like [Ciona intestinalis]
MTTDSSSSAASRKLKGNTCMKEAKYIEAIVEYSEGIMIDPSNAVMYSNRSLAFLKMDQYFYSMKDAEVTIRLVPDWPKGYYRKGQAEEGAKMFDLAIISYQAGLKACKNDLVLETALAEAQRKYYLDLDNRKKRLKKYCVVASVFGTLIVIADMMGKPRHSFIKYPWMRFTLISIAGVIGYMFASFLISLEKSRRSSLLQPPPELMQGGEKPRDPTFLTPASSSQSQSVGDSTLPHSKKE